MMETSSSNCAANPPSESAKLFVGGINESLKEEEIRDYFAKFGEVKEVIVVKDKATGNVREFGFVEFFDPDSAERALNEKEHAIGERKIEVKKARPRGEQRRNYQSPQYQYSNNYCNNENPAKLKKIFVGGLSSSITEEDFKAYFEKFGRITDVVIMYDSSTHHPRGFGFITFDSVEAVDCVLRKKFHELNNKTVEVKVAVPKDSSNQNNLSDSNSCMGGGRGPALSNDQKGYYSPYNPRYEVYPSYAPPPVPGFFYGTTEYGSGNGVYPGYALPPVPGFFYGTTEYGSEYGVYPGYALPPVPGFFYGTSEYVGEYGSGYGVGHYGGFTYGPTFVGARSPWNGLGMVGARRSPVPYGSASMHPSYFWYGGYAGMTGAGGYRGYVRSDNDKLNQSDSDMRITDHSTEDVGREKLDVQQAS